MQCGFASPNCTTLGLFSYRHHAFKLAVYGLANPFETRLETKVISIRRKPVYTEGMTGVNWTKQNEQEKEKLCLRE